MFFFTMKNQLSSAQPTRPDVALLNQLLEESAARHHHLCPRQVLGVRLGLLGVRVLGLLKNAYHIRFRNVEKQLLTIVETDGCGTDGISIATDCFVGRRTLRVLDYGKVAATMIDTITTQAVRIRPRPNIREQVARYAPEAPTRWRAYLLGYQRMPDHELLEVQSVQLVQPLSAILSRPNLRVRCACCDEEIMNEREVQVTGQVLCRHCAGDVYFRIEGG